MTIHDLAKQPFPIGFEFIAADKSGDTWYYEHRPKAVRISKAHNLDGWSATTGKVRWAGVTKNAEHPTKLCFNRDGVNQPHRPKRRPNPNGGRKAAPKDVQERKKWEQRMKYNENRRLKRLANPKTRKAAFGIARLAYVEKLKSKHKDATRLKESIKPPEIITDVYRVKK